MAYYVLKFDKKGKRSAGPSEQAMIQSDSMAVAKGKADAVALSGGGGGAFLQLFNEIGLVATRTPEGQWSL